VLGGALNAGHAASGPRIGFNYVAAHTQLLEEFSFNLFVNSNNGSATQLVMSDFLFKSLVVGSPNLAILI
jgi:hypothetical protein